MRSSAARVTLLGALLVAGALVVASAAQTSTHTVTMENIQFNPRELTVHLGDRIVWVNKDLVPHTATANDKSFDSGSVAADASWSYVAKKKGEYPYTCTFHPTMKGKLTVQ